MPAEKPAKLPPVRVARAVDAVRRRMRRVEQRMVPAPAAVLDLMTGAWVSRAIYTATKFGIADVLQRRSRRSHSRSTPTRMRCGAAQLASDEFSLPHGDDRFGLTPMTKALRADAPASVRGIVLFFGHPNHWEHWGHCRIQCRPAGPASTRCAASRCSSGWTTSRRFAVVFNEGMTSASDTEIERCSRRMISHAWHHRRRRRGHAPRASGVLFDAEPVVAGAPAVLDAAGVADRTAVVGGSFFESVPSGGDAYVLKHIVHDWDESKVLEILRNVRSAMAADTRLLVIETVIPDDDREHLSKLLDLEMLVAGTGKERTAAEYTQLLNRAGFRNTRVIPTVGPVSVVESEAA